MCNYRYLPTCAFFTLPDIGLLHIEFCTKEIDTKVSLILVS